MLYNITYFEGNSIVKLSMRKVRVVLNFLTGYKVNFFLYFIIEHI